MGDPIRIEFSCNIFKSMKKVILLMSLLGALMACTKDTLTNPLDAQLETVLQRLSPDGNLSQFILPDANDLAAIPAGKDNPLTTEKVELGQLLFYETALARDAKYKEGEGTYSCATCHVPSAGFMPGRPQGIADGGVGFGYKGEGRDQFKIYTPEEMDVQGARPISVLNVAYVENTTWNGKFGANHNNIGTEARWGVFDEGTAINHLGLDGLESQNIEGLKVHRMNIDDFVLDTMGYRPFFDNAFEEWEEEERYSLKAASFAISAYLRTLLTTEAPFQNWLKGNQEAMGTDEKRGAVVFFGKAGCYRCHKGPALNANEFYALGVNDLYQTGEAFNTSEEDKRNLGRGGFTNQEEDMYAFKVPGIYNMGDSPFYFHGSSKRSLREVVEYFNNGIPENVKVPQERIAPHLRPLSLTGQEINDLVTFLDQGLKDPDLSRYVPTSVLSGNCFPNNDPTSKSELGCN